MLIDDVLRRLVDLDEREVASGQRALVRTVAARDVGHHVPQHLSRSRGGPLLLADGALQLGTVFVPEVKRCF